jgi:DNA modification methylase
VTEPQAVETILCGDALTHLRTLATESVNCCITSPPYWGLRDYGVEGQLGLERTPEEYVGKVVDVFREVRRVLRDDGTLWLNLGDCYATGAVSYGSCAPVEESKAHDGQTAV